MFVEKLVLFELFFLGDFVLSTFSWVLDGMAYLNRNRGS